MIIYVANYFCIAIYARIAQKKKRKSTMEYNNSNGIFSKMARTFFLLADGWVRYRILVLGRIPCHTYRNFILRHIYCMRIEKNAVIYGGFEIRAPWNISIGAGSIIGDNSILDGRNGIEIGENVNFSTGVNVWTEQHDPNDELFRCTKGGKVQIDNQAWISTRVIILPRVHVYTGAVVAAGAVVVKDCDAYGIYGGVPSKKIGERNKNIRYHFNGEHVGFY